MRKLVTSLTLVVVVTIFGVPSGSLAADAPGAKLIFEGWGVSDATGVAPNYDLWIVNEDGSGLTNLTDDPGYEGNAEWSPDGRRIAFDSDKAGNADIFVMKEDGTGRKRLTSSKVEELWPTWSPNGRRIAYAKGTQLWIMRSDGSHKRKIFSAPGETVRLSDWSPDGRWMSFTLGNHPANTDWDIYVIRPDGSGRKTLIASPDDEGSLKWSPDGRSVVFDRFFGDSCNQATGCNWDIFSADARGKNAVNITNTPLNAEYDAAWSPDGTKIAYADEYGTGGWEADIWVMGADGSNRAALVAKPETFDYSVDWQPSP